MNTGSKVVVRGIEHAGFGEIATWTATEVTVRFYTNAVAFKLVSVETTRVRRAVLPTQTRCFQKIEGAIRYGRVLARQTEASPLETYLVQFGGEQKLSSLREDEFAVRSYLPADDAVDVLANLAHETPFFFEQRFALLEQLLTQARLCRGLPALLSSKVELLQHQVEISARVLLDPTIRYLLADEVGLGKTIEAGIILRQVILDAPETRIGVAVPAALVHQWQTEMHMRFDLTEVEVFAHEDLLGNERNWDVLVIDEAHRVAGRDGEPETEFMIAARAAAENARHLLLLSATPVLHHDADLLALLEMLDPQNYSRRDLPAFQQRTTRRKELGRALLALRNATVPALIKRSAAALVELLPEDTTLRQLVAKAAVPGADLIALQRTLHLHLSETYRIHRRMLRTRRRWLADAEARFHRDIEESVEYELDEDPHLLLWNSLEEWRTECVARVQSNSQLRTVAATCYIQLAEAIASQPDTLSTVVSEVVKCTNASESECALLQRLATAHDAVALIDARIDLITEVLRRRLQRDGKSAKFVVFCPSSGICKRLAKRLQPHIPPRGICIADSSLESGDAAAIFASFATDTTRVLITDSTGEEGFNLQFARAVLFYDLPWSPMRLEQRLGRLDRIDRGVHITCIPLVTAEDDSLALDEAWRRIVSEGLGLFTVSVSDLQYLIDKIMPELRDRAFVGGPAALVDELAAVAETVNKEREAIDEQDVIDGVHGLSSDCPRQSNLLAADEAADKLGATLTNYLKDNIGLKQWWNEEDHSFTFRLPHDGQPLVPVDRLRCMAGLFNAPFTVHRSVAIEDFPLQFLRPGHSAIRVRRQSMSAGPQAQSQCSR